MTYLLKPIFSPCRGDFITIDYKPVYNPKRPSSFNSELPWPTSKSRAASSSSSYSSSPASSCESRDLSSSFSPFFKSRVPRSSLSCPSCKSGAPCSDCKSRVSSSSSSSSYNGVEETSLNLGWFPLSRREAEIVGRAASTIMFAVANKILYKMALVPLREYPFLLALITTFG